MAQSSKRTKKKVDYQLLNSIGRNNESVQDIDLDLSQFITKDNNAETSFQENISVTTPTATNDAPKIKHKYENSTDSSDSDCDLDAEIARLTLQKEKLQKREKIRQLRSDIDNLKTKPTTSTQIEVPVTAARGRLNDTASARMPSTPQRKGQLSTVQSDSAHQHININTLRQSTTLQSQVDKQMTRFPTYEQQYTHTGHRYSHAEPGDTDDELEQHSSVVGKKTFKSGRTAKLYDDVKYPQIWPHTKLNLEFASREITYDQLNTKLFVAGYIESILFSCNTSAELITRLEYLKSLMYNAEVCSWNSILEYNAAVYTAIERGDKQWGDHFLQLESRILRANQSFLNRNPNNRDRQKVKQNVTQSENNNRVWFCKPYQSQNCPFNFTPHSSTIGNRTVQVEHICASCYIADKTKQNHPESSSTCKHFGKAITK